MSTNTIGTPRAPQEVKEASQDVRQHVLNGRLEGVAWGLFLLAIGVVVVVPGEQDDILLAVIGAIMLALNLARVLLGISVSWLTTILGAMAVVAGLSSAFGFPIPWFGLVFVLLGVAVAYRALTVR